MSEILEAVEREREREDARHRATIERLDEIASLAQRLNGHGPASQDSPPQAPAKPDREPPSAPESDPPSAASAGAVEMTMKVEDRASDAIKEVAERVEELGGPDNDEVQGLDLPEGFSVKKTQTGRYWWTNNRTYLASGEHSLKTSVNTKQNIADGYFDTPEEAAADAREWVKSTEAKRRPESKSGAAGRAAANRKKPKHSRDAEERAKRVLAWAKDQGDDWWQRPDPQRALLLSQHQAHTAVKTLHDNGDLEKMGKGPQTRYRAAAKHRVGAEGPYDPEAQPLQTDAPESPPEPASDPEPQPPGDRATENGHSATERNMERILEWAEKQPEPWKIGRISGLGLSPHQIRNAVTKLVEEGTLEQEGHERHAVYYIPGLKVEAEPEPEPAEEHTFDPDAETKTAKMRAAIKEVVAERGPISQRDLNAQLVPELATTSGELREMVSRMCSRGDLVSTGHLDGRVFTVPGAPTMASDGSGAKTNTEKKVVQAIRDAKQPLTIGSIQIRTKMRSMDCTNVVAGLVRRHVLRRVDEGAAEARYTLA